MANLAPVNWSDDRVVVALDRYRRRDGICTLLELQRTIEAAGFRVGKSALSNHAKGVKSGARGRPPAAAKTPERRDGDNSSSRPVVFGGNQFRAAQQQPFAHPSSSTTYPVTELVTSKRLTNSLLKVVVKENTVRLYRYSSPDASGDTKYYRCSKCDSLNRIWRTGVLPRVKVHLGEVVGNADPRHHPQCLPLTEAEAAALQLDRDCRRDVRDGLLPPREAWNKVRIERFKVIQYIQVKRYISDLKLWFNVNYGNNMNFRPLVIIFKRVFGVHFRLKMYFNTGIFYSGFYGIHTILRQRAIVGL